MVTIVGQLEIDFERGVVYFHAGGKTLLRICRLPAPIPEDAMFIDVTHMVGAAYSVPSNTPQDPKSGP